MMLSVGADNARPDALAVTDVSVVICTYHRPLLLTAAIRSVRAQELPADIAVEIVVVDNSPTADAEAVVHALAAEPGLPLRYRSHRTPNIAAARNIGVAATSSAFVAFLDDDERCDRGWIAALVATARRSDADVVIGAVLADFVDGPPRWAGARYWHERVPALDTGAVMGPRHDPRLGGRWLGTGNSMFRRATCFGDAAPFDPVVGRFGGEDTDLFLRLDRQGRRIVWCGTAIVHEVVPRDRADAGYVRARAAQAAGRGAAIAIARTRLPWLAGVLVCFKAAVQAAVRLMLAATSPGSPDRRIRLAQSLGKLLWWRRRNRL